MQITKEVTVLREQIGTEHQRMGRWNIENGGIVTDRDNHRRFESFPDLSDETAFTEIAKLHTMASTSLRKRRGPRTTFTGFLFSSSAALKTLFTSSTKTNFISL